MCFISTTSRTRLLSPCKETEFSSHALLERQDLAKWAEQIPAILGEDLLIITLEYDRFDKTNERLDLLGLDKDGTLVVVELKRDDSGKSVGSDRGTVLALAAIAAARKRMVECLVVVAWAYEPFVVRTVS